MALIELAIGRWIIARLLIAARDPELNSHPTVSALSNPA